MKSLEKKLKDPTIEVLDKTELRSLSLGAEDTSSSEDEGEETEEANDRRKLRMQRRNISTAMQRCIDRILKSSLENDENS